MLMKRSPLYLAFLLSVPFYAWAGRPLYTDDATLTEAHSCQMESWTLHAKGTDQLTFNPACNPYGNFEVTAGYVVQHGAAGVQRSVSLQGKTLLRTLPTDGGYAVGLGFGVSTSVTGATDQSEYVYVPLSLAAHDNTLLTDVNLGWSLDQTTRRHKMTWGMGESVVVSRHITAFAEVFGDSTSNPTLHSGVSFALIPDRVQLDLTAGTNRARRLDRNFYTAGLNVYLPDLRRH